MFGEYNFERMNETDVRENVIVPLLRELGYRHSSSNDIITEQTLRYPKRYIGKKKGGKDPDLRGKADYILDVENRLRWVIEVKAPELEISIDDIEQAYTYAYHPEVRAIYF
ncbi:MAG: type I restriction enzyme HsdR N-terminal domain-containing protein, partial [Parcubacteria group bacterium]|nr:type I restriction enzyme HsdR N-terminal domain-containing protein [Parcubacteria group bacterium]